jgi:hypothetical protein
VTHGWHFTHEGTPCKDGLGDELRVHPRGDGKYAQVNGGT